LAKGDDDKMVARSGKRKAGSTRSRTTSGESAKELEGLTLDFERYLPTVMSSLVAKLRANAAVFFTRSYGVSLAEWRILSFLSEYGPASAYDIWTRANLDKAVVSRETGTLAKKGLVEIEAVKGSARKRSEISLSKAGRELLNRSFSEILRRHDNLTAGLDPAAIETFLQVAKHLESRIPNMSDPASRPLSRHAPVKRIGKNGKAPGCKFEI
jgi:DNA-binding MarR family transcriptional regulator